MDKNIFYLIERIEKARKKDDFSRVHKLFDKVDPLIAVEIPFLCLEIYRRYIGEELGSINIHLFNLKYKTYSTSMENHFLRESFWLFDKEIGHVKEEKIISAKNGKWAYSEILDGEKEEYNSLGAFNRDEFTSKRTRLLNWKIFGRLYEEYELLGGDEEFTYSD